MGYTLPSRPGNPAESAYRFSNWSFERHTHFRGYFSVPHLAGAPPAEARRSPSPRFLYCDTISPYLDRLLPSIMHVCAHVSYEIRFPEKHGLPTNLWSHSGIDHPSRGGKFHLESVRNSASAYVRERNKNYGHGRRVASTASNKTLKISGFYSPARYVPRAFSARRRPYLAPWLPASWWLSLVLFVPVLSKRNPSARPLFFPG